MFDHIAAEAQKMFDQARQVEAQNVKFEAMYGPRKGLPWEDATVEEIATYLEMLRGVEQTYGIRLYSERYWGKSRDEMIAYAEGVKTQDKRRAGVKALKAKYGDDVARKIVAKHSGRTIR